MSFILKPGKNSAWRKHVLNNLVADAILHEKIETSLPTAKSLTKLLAKLITWAKKAEKEKENKALRQHLYRLALRYLVNKKRIKAKKKLSKEKIRILNKLFAELGKKYQNRPGGYSRIVKLGSRSGDNSLRVIFALC
jgi:large subunit ribosomal protein L17